MLSVQYKKRLENNTAQKVGYHNMKISLPQPKHGLIGHRGLAGHAPENTIIGIKTAYEYGLNWVEFDVQLSADGHLILFHDETLNRTTNGQGSVYEHNYADMRQLDAGSWHHPRYQNTQIPHLADQLSEILAYPLQLNIEFKCPKMPTQHYLDTLRKQFCNLIDKLWPTTNPLPLISSFHWDLLLDIRKHHPNIPVGFLCEVITPEVIRLAAQTGNATINCKYREITDIDIAQGNALNIPILAYTVNDPDTAQDLLNRGVFAVFTDSLTSMDADIRKAV